MRMREERLTKRVWKGEASVARLWERPEKRRMDGVVSALGVRGLSLEQGRESASDRREWKVIVIDG